METKLVVFTLTLLASLTISVRNAPCQADPGPDTSTITFCKNPNDRFEKAEKSFTEERDQIYARRGNSTPEIPIVGLAMSGGGIRSNAFQLGLLSGLYSKKLLEKIDYFSAVSGGSWAAAAYKITEDTDKVFFEKIEAEIIQSTPRYGLKSVSPEKTATNQKKILLNSYAELHETVEKGLKIPGKDLTDRYVGETMRDGWQEMIRQHFLQGKDPYLYELETVGYKCKPILIVNATHNATTRLLAGGTESAKHSFPFQFTGRSVGTTADCGNTEYCDGLRYLNGRRYKGAFINIEDNTVKKYFVVPLSQALAASSAVSPRELLGIKLNILTWGLFLHDPDSPSKDDNNEAENKTYDERIRFSKDLPKKVAEKIEEETHKKSRGKLNFENNPQSGEEIQKGAAESAEEDVKDNKCALEIAQKIKENKYDGKSWPINVNLCEVIYKDTSPKKEKNYSEFVKNMIQKIEQTMSKTTEKEMITKEIKNYEYAARLSEKVAEKLHKKEDTPEKPPTVRDKYELTDGGQSDNLGMLALIERRVDTIIISDVAYDPKNGLGDLQAVTWHAQKLLKQDIKLCGKDPSLINDSYALSDFFSDSQNHILKGTYQKNNGSNPKEFYYLRPNQNLDAFRMKLREEDNQLCNNINKIPCKEIYCYLRDNKKDIKFPDDKTMAFDYDEKLISAYYLLGKYLAIYELAEIPPLK